jgi:hypothetical protein
MRTYVPYSRGSAATTVLEVEVRRFQKENPRPFLSRLDTVCRRCTTTAPAADAAADADATAAGTDASTPQVQQLFHAFTNRSQAYATPIHIGM